MSTTDEGGERFPRPGEIGRTCAMNHAVNPLLGRTTVPIGHAKMLSWDALEAALLRAGEVRADETVPCFVVADDGLWIVLERKR